VEEYKNKLQRLLEFTARFDH